MKQQYLEVTYRKGKPLAAYLYLPRQLEDRSARCEKVGEDLVIDFTADGRPIGLEIVNPTAVTLAEINAVLERLQQPPMAAGDLAPLAAA
jgi:uncharacterized protein YuzE